MLKIIISFIVVAALVCIYFLSFEEPGSRFTKYILLMAFVIVALNMFVKKGKG